MAVISFVPSAADDYIGLDRSVQLDVDKALAKLQTDPIKYGDPLGKKAGLDLYGFFSIRAGKRIRVIYWVDGDTVVVEVIGKRERFAAHRTAQARLRALQELTSEELVALEDLLGRG